MFEEKVSIFDNLAPVNSTFPEYNVVPTSQLSFDFSNPLASLEDSIDKIQLQLNDLTNSPAASTTVVLSPTTASSPVSQATSPEVDFTGRGRKRPSSDNLEEDIVPLRRRTASLPDLNSDEVESTRASFLTQRHRSNSEPSLSTNLQLPMRLRDFPESFWKEPELKKDTSPVLMSPPPLFNNENNENDDSSQNREGDDSDTTGQKKSSSPMIAVGPADVQLLFSLFDSARKEPVEIAPSQQIDMMIDFFLQTQCLPDTMDSAINSANPACIMTGSALSAS